MPDERLQSIRARLVLLVRADVNKGCAEEVSAVFGGRIDYQFLHGRRQRHTATLEFALLLKDGLDTRPGRTPTTRGLTYSGLRVGFHGRACTGRFWGGPFTTRACPAVLLVLGAGV